MALSRTADPDTSHVAAEMVEATGTAEAQRDTCLRIVQNEPGLTAAEIANKAGLERHVPSRRLPELRTAGLVRNGPKRMCWQTGNMSMTWEPATTDGQLELL